MTRALSPDNVRIGVLAANQHDANTAVATLGVELGYATEPGPLVEEMLRRESQGTTGLMDGIAIPHAKSRAVIRPGVFVIRLADPVTWPTLDDTDVRLMVALLIPEAEGGTTHLALLSKIARTLVKEPARRELLEATTPETLHEVLSRSL